VIIFQILTEFWNEKKEQEIFVFEKKQWTDYPIKTLRKHSVSAVQNFADKIRKMDIVDEVMEKVGTRCTEFHFRIKR